MDCFVKYEERTREETDDDGNTTEETYLVAVPLTSQTEIYSNIRSRLQAVNDIDQANAIEIYYRMVYGVGAPTEGDGFVEWSEWNGTLSPEAYEAVCSDLPEGEAGSLAVQLAMTRLGDPYSQAKARTGGLYGLQLSYPMGLPAAGGLSSRHGSGAGAVLCGAWTGGDKGQSCTGGPDILVL